MATNQPVTITDTVDPETITPAELLEAAELFAPVWDALLAELRKQVAADEALARQEQS